MSLDCFIGDYTDVSPFYIKCLVVLCLIPGICLFSFLVFILPYALHLRRRGGLDQHRDMLKGYDITSVVIVMFLLPPTATSLSFSMFSCKRLGAGDDDYYLLLDLTQRCWTPSHYAWIWGVAVPTIVLFVFGFPLLSFLYLARNARLIAEEGLRARAQVGLPIPRLQE